MYTIAGYTINTPEQALSVYMLFMLKGDVRIAEQAKAVYQKMRGK